MRRIRQQQPFTRLCAQIAFAILLFSVGPAFARKPVLVGEWSDPPASIAMAVAVQGDYAYVAGGSSGLLVLEIRNPTLPKLVGFCDTGGGAEGVALIGGRVIVADRNAGLRIVDVSVVEAPKILSTYNPGDVRFRPGLAVQNETLFRAAGEGGLEIIDARDVMRLERLALCDTPGSAETVSIYRTTAYVADGTNGVQAIDVTEPRSPRLLQRKAGSARALAIAAPDFSLLLHVENEGRLMITPFAYPDEFFTEEAVRNWPVSHLVQSGNYLLTTRRGGDLTIGNLHPGMGTGRKIGQLAFAPESPSLGDPVIAVKANLAFVASGAGGLHIVDFTTATNPVLVGRFSKNMIAGVAFKEPGQLLFARRGLEALDVSDPERPRAVTGPEVTTPVALNFWHRVVCNGNLAVAGSYEMPSLVPGYIPSSSSVTAFDITDGLRPAGLFSFELGPEFKPDFLAISDSVIFAVYPFDGLLAFDLTNWMTPGYRPQVVIQGPLSQNVAVRGNVVAVGGQLYTWSRSFNRIFATKRGSVGSYDRVVLSTNLALTIREAGDVRLHIHDITDLMSPIKIGDYRILNYPHDFLVRGNMIVLVNATGFELVDVTVPSRPVTAGIFETGQKPLFADLVGNLLAASLSDRIILLDISRPSEPYLRVEDVNGTVNLFLAGDIGFRYRIQGTAKLTAPVEWELLDSVTLSNSQQAIQISHPNTSAFFVRALAE
jgi:hypothetical protein